MPNLFETLTAIDSHGRPTPNLAAAWTLVDDTTWDITLRPDVTFSDGTKLTADDVAFTLHPRGHDPHDGRRFLGICESHRAR